MSCDACIPRPVSTDRRAATTSRQPEITGAPPQSLAGHGNAARHHDRRASTTNGSPRARMHPRGDNARHRHVADEPGAGLVRRSGGLNRVRAAAPLREHNPQRRDRRHDDVEHQIPLVGRKRTPSGRSSNATHSPTISGPGRLLLLLRAALRALSVEHPLEESSLGSIRRSRDFRAERSPAQMLKRSASRGGLRREDLIGSPP